MARISIYIPDDLKTQMDEVGDSANWSEIVRPSIQAAVADQNHRRNGNMTTAIERLRASKEKHLSEQRTEGLADGRSWAQDTAEYDELVRVARMGFDSDTCSGALKALTNTLDPEGAVGRNELWEELFGEDKAKSATNEYAGAFIQGAKEFYEEVEHKL